MNRLGSCECNPDAPGHETFTNDLQQHRRLSLVERGTDVHDRDARQSRLCTIWTACALDTVGAFNINKAKRLGTLRENSLDEPCGIPATQSPQVFA